jgi:hypothetical protein
MSNPLPKKRIFHHLIASRNAYHLPNAFQNLNNSVLIQSEDCLSSVLLRALPGKSEDFSFGMKQRYNIQSTPEEAHLPSSHCFEKCVLFLP